MKNFLKLLTALLLTTYTARAWNEELIFTILHASGKYGTVTVAQVPGSMAWSWDANRNRVILLWTPFAHTTNWFGSCSFAYAGPKTPRDVVVPWGLLQITITVTDNTTGEKTTVADKVIDFRDESWADDNAAYPGHDTFINVDCSSNAVTIHKAEGAPQNFGSAAATIWGIWGKTSYTPLQVHFISTLVFVKNVISNANA